MCYSVGSINMALDEDDQVLIKIHYLAANRRICRQRLE